jgi:hypothetical protein
VSLPEDFTNYTQALNVHPAAHNDVNAAVNAHTDAIADEIVRATAAETIGAAVRPTGVLASTLSRTTPLASASHSSGTIRGTLIPLPAGLLITGITFCSSTAALTGPTNQWFALLDNNYNLLRQTVNDTTNAWATSARKSLALTSTFTTTYSGFHNLIVCVTNNPVTSFGIAVSASLSGVITAPPLLGFVGDTGLTTTCPATVTVGNSTTYMQYAEVY